MQSQYAKDIVQFSSDIYYCSEAEGSVRVEAGLDARFLFTARHFTVPRLSD